MNIAPFQLLSLVFLSLILYHLEIQRFPNDLIGPNHIPFICHTGGFVHRVAQKMPNASGLPWGTVKAPQTLWRKTRQRYLKIQLPSGTGEAQTDMGVKCCTLTKHTFSISTSSSLRFFQVFFFCETLMFGSFTPIQEEANAQVSKCCM